MNTMIISYSYTGNNAKLASSIASKLTAEHIVIKECRKRTVMTTVMDMLLNRTPMLQNTINKIPDNTLVIFVGPVWMGKVASPFRALLKNLRSSIQKYAFISISGGALGPNPKLLNDLVHRTKVDPVTILDLHIADLLPSGKKPSMHDTSSYRLTTNDLNSLTQKVLESLKEYI